MFIKDLHDGFRIHEISFQEYKEFLDRNFCAVFDNRIENAVSSALASSEKRIARSNEYQKFTLRLGVFYQDQMIGWHYGHASDPETYYMQNSAILPDYRNQGLYGKLLSAVLEKVQNEEFQVITSLHHPNNAAILIPKLKAGFVITGIQLHERFRYLIELRYIFDPERRQNFHRSIGLDV